MKSCKRANIIKFILPIFSKKFKKITELSKLGIKLSEILSFIDSGKIDFMKFSDKFKEHYYGLVSEMNGVLDVLTPQAARTVFLKMDENFLNVDLSKREEKSINDACATNSNSCEASTLKENVELRAQL